MQDLRGKTAFITGGASGIGLAMAEVFGREGMNVCVADVDRAALSVAVASLQDKGVRVAGAHADVTSRASVQEAALACLAAFGKVHLVCNNAGVAPTGVFGATTLPDWRWLVDVNLKGVIHGVDVFTPLLESHGEGGHFVNTASMAGLFCQTYFEGYSATKFAVVAMSEGWRVSLEPRGIGVSVLCPGVVDTPIFSGRRNRGAAYGGPIVGDPASERFKAAIDGSGIAPAVIAERVLEAVRADELHIITHSEFRGVVEARFARLMQAFDRAAQSPALKEIDADA